MKYRGGSSKVLNCGWGPGNLLLCSLAGTGINVRVSWSGDCKDGGKYISKRIEDVGGL